MNLHPPLLELVWAERIGWTLVHSVWQVAIVAAAFALATFVLRRQSANVRYVLGCVALVAMIAWPATTFTRMPPAEQSTNRSAAAFSNIKADPVSVAADAEPSETVEPADLGPAPQPS